MAHNKKHISRAAFMGRLERNLILQGLKPEQVKKAMKEAREVAHPKPVKITRKDREKMETLINKDGESVLVVLVSKKSRKVWVVKHATYESYRKNASRARKAQVKENQNGETPESKSDT